jgi:hypothetical protein
MDTAADAAALRADTAVPPQAPIVILRMSTRPTREPCPIGATLLPNHLEDIMLLSPDRGRGRERGYIRWDLPSRCSSYAVRHDRWSVWQKVSDPPLPASPPIGGEEHEERDQS